jgi:hypothetical protein
VADDPAKMARQVGLLVAALQVRGYPAYRISTSTGSYEGRRLWHSRSAVPLCAKTAGTGRNTRALIRKRGSFTGISHIRANLRLEPWVFRFRPSFVRLSSDIWSRPKRRWKPSLSPGRAGEGDA